MIRDIHLRVLFIPLLGFSLPLISGLIHYSAYPAGELFLSNSFFFLTSWCIWSGSTWMHKKLRRLFAIYDSPFQKISMICGVQSLYGACIGGISALTWLSFSREIFHWNTLGKFILLCMLAVIIFTLVYEILYLSKERIHDTNLVVELDQERSRAELIALANELDPHFIFNSLTTLDHLIQSNPPQARLFNNKLAQVYQYFLVNKGRDLIPLEEELDFIRNYYFLLQLRHEKKITLNIQLGEKSGGIMLPPFALQLLLENAIKHNELSETNPLCLDITLKQDWLEIRNNYRPKALRAYSTGIGLKNLGSRYRIISHQDIRIEKKPGSYAVLLPILHLNQSVRC